MAANYDNPPSRFEWLLALLVIFLPLAGVMIWISLSTGFESEIGKILACAQQLNAEPVSKIIGDRSSCADFSSYLYVLKFISWLCQWTGMPFSSPKIHLLIKAPAVIAHMVFVLLFFRFARQIYAPSRLSTSGLMFTTCLVAFLPGPIINAANLGQPLAIFNLIAFGVLLALLFQRIYAAAALFALLLTFKPLALFYLPVIVIFGLRDRWLSQPKKTIGALAIVTVTVCLILKPFWNLGLEANWDNLIAMFSSSPFATMNGFNFYMLIGKNLQPTSETHLFGMNPTAIFIVGTVLVSQFVFLSVRLSKSWPPRTWSNEQVFLGGAIFALALFLLLPRMREPFIMPVFPILAGCFACSRLTNVVFVSIGTALAISQAMVFDSYFGAKLPMEGPMLILISFINLGSLLLLLERWRQVAHLTSPSNIDFSPSLSFQSCQATPSHSPDWFERWNSIFANIPDLPRIRRLDVILIALALATNFSIGFYKLGKTKLPQTSFSPAETISLKLPAGSRVTNVWIYAHTAHGDISIGCGSETPRAKVSLSVVNYYSWRKRLLDKPCDDDINLSFSSIAPDGLGEVALTSEDKGLVHVEQVCAGASCEAGNAHPLTDETHAQNFDHSYLESTIFDEVYYARAAIELNQGKFPYENTHPPLGKLLPAVMVKYFGVGTLQWRAVGAFFGLMLPFILFAIAWIATGNRGISYATLFLSTFDFSRVVLARSYTIEIYVAAFLFLAYFFLFLFLRSYCRNLASQTPFKVTSQRFFLMFAVGMFLGLAIATKWNALFSTLFVAGLMCLVLGWEWRRRIKFGYTREPPVRFAIAVIGALGCFPIFLYWASYWPYSSLLEGGFSFSQMIQNQKSMWDYHSGLKATHAFSSKFYTWPFIQKPVWFHSDEGSSSVLRSTIVFLGNPSIWWAIFPALAAIIYSNSNRKQWTVYLLILGFVCQYLPWMIASRITFIYHYFLSANFGLIIVAVAINQLHPVRHRWSKIAYFATCLLLFIWFWPALTGLEASQSYLDRLRWFKGWYF